MMRWIWLLLTVLVLLGAGFRLYKLDEKSLWSDEIATIATSMGNSIDPDAYALRGQAFDPPAAVPAEVYKQKATLSHGAGNFAQTTQVLKSNVHPPLFFWLMNGWIHQFGLTPDALRFPAVLFGILGIPVMFALAWRLAALNKDLFAGPYQAAFALLASGMLAVSAYQVDHAQDARQYTFLLLLAMTAVWLAVGLVQPNGRGWLSWLALALVLAMGLYTQYFFLLFTGFVLVYLAWHGLRNRNFLLKTALTAGMVGALFMPWFSVFQVQMAFFKSVGHYTAGLWNPLRLPEKLWRIASEFFIPDHPLGKVLPLVILVIILAAGLLIRQTKERPIQRRFGAISPALGVILLWLLVVIGGQVGLDILKHTHTATIRRYLFLASPACYLLMAYGLVWLFQRVKNERFRWLPFSITALLLGLMSWDTAILLTREHHSSDEFKQAAAWIASHSQPEDLVLVNKSGAMAVGLAYYLPPQTRMMGVNVPAFTELLDGSPLMKRLDAQVSGARHEGIWLVFTHSAPSTQERLGAWLTGKQYQLAESHKFPGVKVFRWHFKPTQPSS